MKHLSVRNGLGLFAAFVLSLPVATQAQQFSQCSGIAFSTEEDFVSPVGESTDGNQIISDGDLLAWQPTTGSVTICARAAELLPTGTLVEVPQALGLDAVDVILPQEGFIAFSTELDEQFGLFGHGDLLFPTGTIIPNATLVARFQLPKNMGLDAVQFIGEQDAIISAINFAAELGKDQLEEDPEAYLNRLEELEVDIWFSLEGTSEPTQNPDVLDGDLLSAVSGTIVTPNEVLLDTPVPAGLVERGVDFGLDAVSADRHGNQETIRFSTEILYRGETPFSDGDVLDLGGALAVPNERLLSDFFPKADFLGLDALGLSQLDLDFGNPHIDTLCGRSYAAADFGPDGLWRASTAISPPGNPPRRPCGLLVPIDGTLPSNLQSSIGTISEFRVVWESLTTPGASGEIETEWRLVKPTGLLNQDCLAEATPSLSTDGIDGWMNAADFIAAKQGDPAGPSGNGIKGCSNAQLHLAVWDTAALPAALQNDLMQIRLEWRTAGGATAFGNVAYRIQLDNQLPQIAAYPGGFEVRLMDGVEKVPACGEAPSDQSTFQVWADFNDPYYWNFTLRINGGVPPVTHYFLSPAGPKEHEYYNTPDGLPQIDNTNDTGTTPAGTLVHLRDIDMSELGESFKRCCYLLELIVRDASIRHSLKRDGSGFRELDLFTRRITTFQAGS